MRLVIFVIVVFLMMQGKMIHADLEYNTWVSIWNYTDLYIPIKILVKDDIYCYSDVPDNKTAGCAKLSNSTIMIKTKHIAHIDRAGHDIFLHEYLHFRCEWFNRGANYHVDNNNPLFVKGINYWDTCGRLTQSQ